MYFSKKTVFFLATPKKVGVFFCFVSPLVVSLYFLSLRNYLIILKKTGFHFKACSSYPGFQIATGTSASTLLSSYSTLLSSYSPRTLHYSPRTLRVRGRGEYNVEYMRRVRVEYEESTVEYEGSTSIVRGEYYRVRGEYE